MNRKLFLLSILIFFLLFSTNFAVAEKRVEKDIQPEQIEARQLDREAEILAAYLEKHDSPLQYHAQDFIDAAREYDLDWRLLPAIAGVESTFGKFTPGGSRNAWGWGVYGNQAIHFASWRDGIFTVSEGLREKYVNKGLTNPYLMNRVYATSPYWGGKVTYFMQDLERFAKEKQPVADIRDSQLKIAAISGKLAL